MWNSTARAQHSRVGLRYGSDLTDAEWQIIAPLLPKPCRRGRKRRWGWREVVNAMFYVLRAGCPWRFLPDSFAPWRTVYRWFDELRDTAALKRLNHHPMQLDR
jgi:transposase